MKYKIYFLKIFFFLILVSPFYSKKLSAEINSNIVIAVGNEIITNYDMEQEKLYLSLINQININSLNKKQLDEMVKDSLIKEKIKLIEINRQNYMEIDNNFVNLYVQQIYRRLNLNDLDEFKYLLNKNNLNFEEFLEKLKIELKWNEIIYSLFANKIQINKEQIDQKINLLIKKKQEKEFLISEIFVTGKNKNELKDRIIKVQKSILEIGFENTAIKYSSSDTSKNGGKLGWIGESQISEKILNQIKITNIGSLTEPIKISGGKLIIELKNKRSSKEKIDVKKKFDEILKAEKNYQLNNFSIYYFQRIKNNIIIKNY